jgi:hypothetical protein
MPDFLPRATLSMPLRRIFSAESRDFHRKILGACEKVAQLNRTSSKRSHDEPSQERTMPPSHSFFCCGRKQFRVHPDFAALVREGTNQMRACRFSREAPRPVVRKSTMRTFYIRFPL